MSTHRVPGAGISHTARRLARVCFAAGLVTVLMSGCGRDPEKPSPEPATSSAQASAAPGKGSGPGPGGVPESVAPSSEPSPTVDFTAPEAVAKAYVYAYTKRTWRTDRDPARTSIRSSRTRPPPT